VKKIPEKPVKESLEELKKDLDSNKINWADYVMADDSDSSEINLGDFDFNDNGVVASASTKIENGKALPALVYVKTALSELGYETNNHNPFFFTSLVNVTDKELSGFLYVNRDGLYSNYKEKSELQLIFSWETVDDIELVEEDEFSVRVNIVSKEGKLTIHEPYSKNMLVLLSIYKNSWEKVLREEIDIITFDTQEEYLNWIQEKNS
jgi:hypothetical protein